MVVFMRSMKLISALEHGAFLPHLSHWHHFGRNMAGWRYTQIITFLKENGNPSRRRGDNQCQSVCPVTHKKGFISDISQVKILCVMSDRARKSAKIKGQKFGSVDSNLTLADINC